jgi:hypothetical protein
MGLELFDLDLIIGIVGMVMLLAAFALNLLKFVTEKSYIYILLNIFGAGILVYHAFVVDSIPFMILEAVWALFAIYKLVIVLSKGGRE